VKKECVELGFQAAREAKEGRETFLFDFLTSTCSLATSKIEMMDVYEVMAFGYYSLPMARTYHNGTFNPGLPCRRGRSASHEHVNSRSRLEIST
jgi:hypothetical protein